MPLKILSPTAQRQERLNQPRMTRAQAFRQIQVTLNPQLSAESESKEKRKHLSSGPGGKAS